MLHFLWFLLGSSSSSEPVLRRACALVDKVSDESLTHSMQIMWRIFVLLNCLSFTSHLLPFSFLKFWKKYDLHSVYFLMKNYLYRLYLPSFVRNFTIYRLKHILNIPRKNINYFALITNTNVRATIKFNNMLFIVSISCWLKIEEINCRVIVFNFLLLYIQSYMTDYIK